MDERKRKQARMNQIQENISNDVQYFPEERSKEMSRRFVEIWNLNNFFDNVLRAYCL